MIDSASMRISVPSIAAGEALIHVKDPAAARGYLSAMSTRAIIEIDQERCTGCGLCIPNCPEGALRVIDGKARLVSDLFCDGLGACIGYCPEGAITVTQREAAPYDERTVMEGIMRQGPNVIRAHLEHLKAHGEEGLLAAARAVLEERGVAAPELGEEPERPAASASVGATAAEGASASMGAEPPARQRVPAAVGTRLSNWPIQLHLLSPMAPRFRGADVLLSADCVAHAVGSFHQTLLAGKALAIACPKLDDGKDVYQEKLTALIDHGQIRSLTVAMMEVPCCGGLLRLARAACAKANRKVPLKALVVSIADGSVASEELVEADG
jgi:ferredoxin